MEQLGLGGFKRAGAVGDYGDDFGCGVEQGSEILRDGCLIRCAEGQWSDQGAWQASNIQINPIFSSESQSFSSRSAFKACPSPSFNSLPSWSVI